MNLMRRSLPDAAQYLEEVGYARWARSHFTGMRYSAMTSNSAESVNSVTRFARYLPITQLVEFYRATVQQWYFIRRHNGGQMTSAVTPWAEAKIEKRIHRSATWRVHPITDLLFEVVDGYKNGKCDLRDKTCTCKQWDISGIPCGHVISVARTLGIEDCSQFCSVWFKSDSYRGTYEEEVNPLPPPAEYVLPENCMTVLPPPMELRNSGRPRNRDRIPSRDEEPIVKTCSRCQQKGHFRYNCPSPLPTPQPPGSSSGRKKSVSRTTGPSQPDTTQEYVVDTYDLSK